MQYPMVSGICGALASYGGKIAFQDDSLWYVRLVGLVMMLQLNKWMFQFSFKSMQLNGSSVTVLLQFITGNFMNALNGYLLGESLPIQWFGGMALMLLGVWLISGDQKCKKD